MAQLVYRMNVSLDGYVNHDHERMASGPALFRHWTEKVGSVSAAIYGRCTYELMQYWDEDQDGWNGDHRAFAETYRRQKKFVASRTLGSVGPNATLISGDILAEVVRLKAAMDGEISVTGPVLTGSLIAADLIDRYELYYHPVALVEGGRPFFTHSPPPLRLVGHDEVGDGVIRLSYVRG